jgi:hypothetical protein
MQFNAQIPFFYEGFLSNPASAPAKSFFWILSFDGVYLESNPSAEQQFLPIPAIKRACSRGEIDGPSPGGSSEVFEPMPWNIDHAMKSLLISDYFDIKGCLFVQDVNLPSESITANPEGIQTNGFMRTYSGAGRDANLPLRISFLETNVSFVDNIIRPWVITTGHLGLIARSGDLNYRCNITVRKFGVLRPDFAPFEVCRWKFFGACPTEVLGEECTYTASTSPTLRAATFIYHYYKFESSHDNIDNDSNIRTSFNKAIVYNKRIDNPIPSFQSTNNPLTNIITPDPNPRMLPNPIILPPGRKYPQTFENLDISGPSDLFRNITTENYNYIPPKRPEEN